MQPDFHSPPGASSSFLDSSSPGLPEIPASETSSISAFVRDHLPDLLTRFSRAYLGEQAPLVRSRVEPRASAEDSSLSELKIPSLPNGSAAAEELRSDRHHARWAEVKERAAAVSFEPGAVDSNVHHKPIVETFSKVLDAMIVGGGGKGDGKGERIAAAEWLVYAIQDLADAQTLACKDSRSRNALYLSQQSLEKLLKALRILINGEVELGSIKKFSHQVSAVSKSLILERQSQALQEMLEQSLEQVTSLEGYATSHRYPQQQRPSQHPSPDAVKNCVEVAKEIFHSAIQAVLADWNS